VESKHYSRELEIVLTSLWTFAVL